MPVPSQIRRAIVVDHTIDFGGVEVTFRFDRNKITDTWMNAWTALENEQATGAINIALADLIEDWDIRNEDGTPYPPTPENIGYLFSLSDKGRIVKELMTAGEPTRAEGEDSAATSSSAKPSSTVPPESPQNGLAPLLSQTPSASLSTK